MSKRVIEPNTTLYPVPVVLITTGGDTPDVMTCNRIASCSAEPPRLSISVRPVRYSHTLIKQTGEFVVNIPAPAQRALTDYVGVVTGREEDKIAIAGLELTPALKVKTPLLADCPVNIECIVERKSNWTPTRCSLAGCRPYTWTNRSWTSGVKQILRGPAVWLMTRGSCGNVQRTSSAWLICGEQFKSRS